MLALYDGDAAAIEPLGAMGPAARPSIPAFERLLNRFRDKDVVVLSARALLQIGGEGPGIVRARLDGEDDYLTLALLEGVRSAGAAAKEFRTDFLRLAHHPSNAIRTSAIDALHSLGARGEDVRAMLLRALRGENREVRLASARALGAMGPEAMDAIPVLTELLIDSRAGCRHVVVEALGRISPNDRQAFTALVETLTDPDEGVSKTAIEALAGAGTDAVAALRSACHDQRESVCVAAACALWRVKDQRDEAGRVLRGIMLDGKAVGARIEACEALWKLERTREVVPVLCLLLRDGSDRSEAIIETLCNLDGALDDVRAFVKPLLRHELRTVRVAAWRVLDRIAPDLTDALAAAGAATK
jgi:HEAT repeat protein